MYLDGVFDPALFLFCFRSGLGVITFVNGDRYEGHWLVDKKEGPGRYFYTATGKVYTGEWVDDVPKCGVSGTHLCIVCTRFHGMALSSLLSNTICDMIHFELAAMFSLSLPPFPSPIPPASFAVNDTC